MKERTAELDAFMKLFVEFDPNILKIKNVEIKTRKIAGVKTPLLENIEFEIADYNLFKSSFLYPEGIALLKEMPASN